MQRRERDAIDFEQITYTRILMDGTEVDYAALLVSQLESSSTRFPSGSATNAIQKPR